MEFEIGDEVKYCEQSGGEIIYDIDKKGYIKGKYINNGNISTTYCNPKNYKLVKRRNLMNQHEDLKTRIEAVEAWGKECDDLIHEIVRNDSNSEYYTHFEIETYKEKGYIKIYFGCKCADNTNEKFNYTSQCEKLEAFKKALLWLLDHSDISKVDKKREKKIDELKEQMERIQEQIENLA